LKPNKFNKIWKFLRNQDEFGTYYAVDKHTKMSVKISVDRYIGRSLLLNVTARGKNQGPCPEYHYIQAYTKRTNIVLT